MNPKDIKTRYGLTYAQLAVLLSKDQRTVERYCAGDCTPQAVKNYCWLLDFYLAQQKQLPPFMLVEVSA